MNRLGVVRIISTIVFVSVVFPQPCGALTPTIIGPDLAVRDGRLVGLREHRADTDQALRGLKKALKEDPEGAEARAELLIRKTYRTLLTRGMKGTYIFCTDPDVAEFIRGRLPSTEAKAA